MKWLKIVCLAKSRKNQGYCIAGKIITSKKWIRAISGRKTEELIGRECKLNINREVEVLDIVEIPVIEHKPNEFQFENFLINDRWNWKYIEEFNYNDLKNLCDYPKDLWLIKNCSDCSSSSGENDRVPEKEAKRFKESLYFITPDTLKLFVRTEYRDTTFQKKRLRAEFSYRGIKYILSVTDIYLEKIFLKDEEAIYEIKKPKHKIYMCVSLGLPYKGYCYKFVSSILPSEKVLKEFKKLK